MKATIVTSCTSLINYHKRAWDGLLPFFRAANVSRFEWRLGNEVWPFRASAYIKMLIQQRGWEWGSEGTVNICHNTRIYQYLDHTKNCTLLLKGIFTDNKYSSILCCWLWWAIPPNVIRFDTLGKKLRFYEILPCTSCVEWKWCLGMKKN